MKNEQIRLFKLLKAGKINEADFVLLSDAIKHKKPLIYSIFEFLINPFQQLAGKSGLVVGILIVLALSIVSKLVGVHLLSLTSYYIVPPDKQHLINFSLSLEVNLITCLTLSILFILASRVCGQKSWRVMDFVTMVLLARLPYLVITSIIVIADKIHPHMANATTGITALLGYLLISYALLWQIVIWFYGFRDISGLQGNKLWLSFIFCIIIAEEISFYLISLLIWIY